MSDSQQLETVEGKTWQEWYDYFRTHATEYQAREMATLKMGWPLDRVQVDDNEQPIDTGQSRPIER